MRTALVVAVFACLLLVAQTASVAEVSDQLVREKRSRPADFVDPMIEVSQLLAMEEENDEFVLEQAHEAFKKRLPVTEASLVLPMSLQ